MEATVVCARRLCAQVWNLSVNFWLVLPILTPESAPIVHPVLEGVFNFLLAWAALFSGFLIDGRVSEA
jgi:hypothetical protein